MTPTTTEVTPRRTSILVVEDERIVAKDLQRRLVELGYDVPATASTAASALALATERAPDLVLMDIELRDVQDGIEIAEILRDRFDIPVVYLSAFADATTIARARLTEPYGYLTKPVNVDELRSTVEVAIHKHAMERRLKERERWYATTLRSIGDAVISTDAKGMVRFMNPVAEEILGAREEHVRGRPLGDVLRLVDELTRARIDNPIERALTTGMVQRLEPAVYGDGDNARILTDSAAPIIDDRGTVLGAVIVFQDVTEERRLRRQLELSDRLASLGSMAAGIAHEINNPLTVAYANLRLALETARAATPLDEGAREALRYAIAEAITGVERIQRIVTEISAIAQRGRPMIARTTDVVATIELALRYASHELDDRARVTRDFQPVTDVLADETRLSQVLVNLLVNAAHAIAPGDIEGNEVAISTAMGVDPEGHDEVVISIRDTGSGMTPDVKARIFEPFFTTKEAGRGTGLGLAISHGIVTSFRGRLLVDSAPGAGTTFRVCLPRATTTTDSAATTTPTTPTTTSTTRMEEVPTTTRPQILIVDDEPVIRRIMSRILGRDYEVTAPASATEALILLRNGRRYDAIVCDLMMPDFTGMEIHAELFATLPDQARRMVFVSGGSFETHIIEFVRSIPNPKLDKPFAPDDLRALVARTIAAFGALLPGP